MRLTSFQIPQIDLLPNFSLDVINDQFVKEIISTIIFQFR